MKISDTEILYQISLSILLIISLIISFQRRGNKETAGRFLVIFFWCFWYSMLVSYLVLFRYVSLVPHLIRTANLTGLIIFPASFFYFMQTLKPRRLKTSDLLHLLPLLVYFIDYFPFFILPGHAKIRIMEPINTPHLMIGFSEGWFMPRYGHYVIREMQFFAYCLAQLVIVSKVIKSPEHPVIFGDSKIVRWLLTFVVSQCLFFVLPLVSQLFSSTSSLSIFFNLGPILVSLILGLYLIFQPEILYGSSGYFQKPQTGSKEETSYQPGIVNDNDAGISQPEIVSEEALDTVEDNLDQFMMLNKPFLRPGYKLVDLSNDTRIPIYKISAYVNRRKNQNFFGYLNQFRIEYCLGKLVSKEYESKTLEAISEECGFQNRTTFIRVFKSVMGMTPTEYINKG